MTLWSHGKISRTGVASRQNVEARRLEAVDHCVTSTAISKEWLGINFLGLCCRFERFLVEHQPKKKRLNTVQWRRTGLTPFIDHELGLGCFQI